MCGAATLLIVNPAVGNGHMIIQKAGEGKAMRGRGGGHQP